MNPTSVLSDALLASGPHPKLVQQLGLFSPLIGSWDVEVIQYLPDGSQQGMDAEWHFGWALEGRAVMDVWIAPKRGLRNADTEMGDYGVTIRFYDKRIDAWRSTWIGPVKNNVLPFIARKIEDAIVLEGKFEDDLSTRWIFSDITSDSFHWRALESADDWRTYTTLQEMLARRVS